MGGAHLPINVRCFRIFSGIQLLLCARTDRRIRPRRANSGRHHQRASRKERLPRAEDCPTPGPPHGGDSRSARSRWDSSSVSFLSRFGKRGVHISPPSRFRYPFPPCLLTCASYAGVEAFHSVDHDVPRLTKASLATAVYRHQCGLMAHVLATSMSTGVSKSLTSCRPAPVPPTS